MRSHALIHRHIDVLPLARLAPGLQRQHDSQGRPDPGDRVGDVIAHALGRAVRVAGYLHPTGHSLYTEVVGRPIRVGATEPVAVAVAGDGGVHQARVNLLQMLVAQSQTPEGARSPVVQQHVAGPDHVFESPFTGGVAQVQGHALLVAVDAQVSGADPPVIRSPHERPPRPGLVPGAGTLHFYYLRPHIGQDQRTKGASHYVGSVQHSYPFQGQREFLRVVGHATPLVFGKNGGGEIPPDWLRPPMKRPG